jgi:hypothetical protein
VVPEVEGIPQVNALVSVGFVVQGQGGENAQLNAGGIAVLLNGSNDLDGTFCPLFLVVGLHHFAKGPLTEELDDIIYKRSAQISYGAREHLHRSVRDELALTI